MISEKAIAYLVQAHSNLNRYLVNNISSRIVIGSLIKRIFCNSRASKISSILENKLIQILKTLNKSDHDQAECSDVISSGRSSALKVHDLLMYSRLGNHIAKKKKIKNKYKVKTEILIY